MIVILTEVSADRLCRPELKAAKCDTLLPPSEAKQYNTLSDEAKEFKNTKEIDVLIFFTFFKWFSFSNTWGILIGHVIQKKVDAMWLWKLYNISACS